MRVESDLLDAEVLGTSDKDHFEASVFRDGRLVAGPLKIGTHSFGWSDDRQVQGQATVVVADPDGSLSPWGMGDPLAPGGSRMHLTWVSGTTGIRVPFGPWRIRTAHPSNTWRVYPQRTETVQIPGTETGFTVDEAVVTVDDEAGTFTVADGYVTVDDEAGTFTVSDGFAELTGFTEITTIVPAHTVFGGGTVTLQIDEDVTATAGMEGTDGVAPKAGASVLAEAARLIQRFGAIDATYAPDDATVQASYAAYPKSLLDALDHLADMMKARLRVGPDGALQFVPLAGVGPAQTLQGGTGGALIGADRVLSDADVFNHFISTGTTADGREVVGRAFIEGGPLKWDGAFGRVPVRHQSTAQSLAGAVADAEAVRDEYMASGSIDLPVTCLAHPGRQIHDIVDLVVPTLAGDATLTGRVVGIVWNSVTVGDAVTTGKSMDLTVRVSTDALEAVAAKVRLAIRSGVRRG
mgnify:CR=1 FL=1